MGVCLSLIVAPLVHVVSGQEQMCGALLLWKVHTNLDARQSGILYSYLLYSHIEKCIRLYLHRKEMNSQ